MQRILIVGGGFGGIYTLKSLHKHFCGNKDVKISMVGVKNYFLFTPLLHEVATGSINPENIVEPVHKVLGCCIDHFYLGRAERVSLKDKIVKVGKEKIPYDYLVLAPGAETNFYNIPGAEKFALPLKSLEDAKEIKNRCIAALEQASKMKEGLERKTKLAFAVVGGGPTGVELVAELHEFLIQTFSHYYPKDIIKDITIAIIQRGPELIPQFGPRLRKKSLDVLKRKGINVLLRTEVKEVKEKEIILNNGTLLASENVFWVAGIKPAEINFEGEIPKLVNGRVAVNEYLEILNHKGVFALGDFAFFEDKRTLQPVPALAQAATKEAKIVALNIKRSLEGAPTVPFQYKSSGSLVSVGQWMAVGEIWGIAISGRFTWWLWRTVYLFKLVSNVKKVKVAIDWTVNLFLPRDISQL